MNPPPTILRKGASLSVHRLHSRPGKAARTGRFMDEKMAEWVIKHLLLCFAVCAIGLAPRILQAQEPTSMEKVVKSIYLIKFPKFVDWPDGTFANPEESITIGILGKDPFGKDFERLIEDQTAKGRHFIIKRSQEVQELEECHVLFICSSETEKLPGILEYVANKPVLTVGDTEEFSRLGGIIKFVKAGENVKFKINIEAAEGAKLTINPQLKALSQ